MDHDTDGHGNSTTFSSVVSFLRPFPSNHEFTFLPHTPHTNTPHPTPYTPHCGPHIPHTSLFLGSLLVYAYARREEWCVR